jgi:hypothetical protein
VLSKRVPILGEGIACNQDPDFLHCKALKRAKSLGELKIKSLAIIPLIKNVVTRSRTGLQIYEGRDDQLNRPGPMA